MFARQLCRMGRAYVDFFDLGPAFGLVWNFRDVQGLDWGRVIQRTSSRGAAYTGYSYIDISSVNSLQVMWPVCSCAAVVWPFGSGPLAGSPLRRYSFVQAAAVCVLKHFLIRYLEIESFPSGFSGR